MGAIYTEDFLSLGDSVVGEAPAASGRPRYFRGVFRGERVSIIA